MTLKEPHSLALGHILAIGTQMYTRDPRPDSPFARIRHLRGEPRSRAHICAHYGAYTVRRSLICAPINLNAFHASSMDALKH